jgi:PAS domain S-box-containing protein
VYLDANPAACELFGLPWEAMIGKTPADFSPPSLKETISESWAGFLEEGHQEGVFQLQRPDGTVLDLEYRARAHYLPGRHLSVLRDVTERQAMENALRDSEEQFRTLIEQSPLSVQILSPEGTILQVNRAWEELWGLKLEQVRDYNILQDQQLVEKGAMPFIRRGFEGEAVRVPPIVYDRGQSMPDLVKSQDPERWVRAYIYPIKDASGQIQKVVLIDEDFTDRIRLEEKLRQRAEELAEETARKDRFLAMLAHELRNPLAPILNAVHILRMRGGDDPSMQRAQDVVERQVHHMTRLIDELLDLSRITRGKIILQQKSLKLSEVFDHAVQAVHPLIESRRHVLSVSLPPEPLWVFADPDRLEQILTNLLNNAAKYTEPGGKITLSGAHEDGEIVLRVKDTGIGIDREMLPHVFDLFAQADRSLDRSSGGLGIGLTLVKNLVQLHHGSVEAQSAGPGAGAEFVVRLPSATARNTEEPVSPKATISPATESYLKVLVVEDNADGREMIRHLLELWGHEVELAENGPEGVQKAAAFQPDVALVDIGLPGLDGFGVAQRIRALANGNGITLIALSGYGRPEDRSQALDSGFDSYLTKPVDPEVLNRLLKK